jgi:hypothetical protein
MVVVDESIAACAHNKDNNINIRRTTNNDYGGMSGNSKKDLVLQRGTHMSVVGQPPTGPRIRAA